VIHGFPCEDMTDADTEVELKIEHKFKIIQTFVLQKFIF